LLFPPFLPGVIVNLSLESSDIDYWGNGRSRGRIFDFPGVRQKGYPPGVLENLSYFQLPILFFHYTVALYYISLSNRVNWIRNRGDFDGFGEAGESGLIVWPSELSSGWV